MKRSTVFFLVAMLILLMGNTAYSQHFEFEQTDVNHSILATSADLNGENLVADDEIAVFTENDLCAGATRLENDQYPVGIAAWGDEAQVGGINGFVANEEFTFKFWDASAETEYDDIEAEYQTELRVWAPNGFTVVDLTAVVDEEPQIALDPEFINFGDVIVNEQVVEMLTIRNVGGAPLAISDVTVQGDGFSVEFEGGEGEPAEFDWAFEQTDNNHSFLVQEAFIGDELLTEDNVIGVFTEEDLCAGFTVVTGYPSGVAAWGDEAQQQGINGFVANEVVNFRIFDVEAGIEYAAEPTLFQDHLGIYAPNGFSVVVSLDATDILRGGGGGALVLSPDGSIDVPVTFAPDDEDEYEGLITVFSDDPDNPEAEALVFGVGVVEEDLPRIHLFVDELNFGDVEVGTSETQVLAIRNDGDAVLEVELSVVEGDYFRTSPPNVNIDPGHAYGAGAFFEPEEEGEFRGVLRVGSNDPDNPELFVDLVGNAFMRAPEISVDPLEIDFGNVIVGEVADDAFRIVNVGDAPLAIADVYTEDDGFSVDFEGGGGEPVDFDWEFEQTDNNHSFLVQDAFIGEEQLAPDNVIGVFTEADLCAGFTVVEGYPSGVAAWGDEAQQQGINGFVANEVVNFRIFDVEAGIEYAAEPTLFEDHLGIYAPNGFSVVVSLDATDMLRGGGGGEVVLEPDDELVVPVHFSPEEVQEYNGVVVIESDDENNPAVQVALSGIGVAEPVPDPEIVVPDVIDFGEVLVGEQGEEVLVIGNEGGQPLTVDGIDVVGDGFTVDFGGGGGEPVEFDWEFEQTDNNHSFLVQEAFIGDELLSEDNVIGVFTEADLCAGFTVVTGYPSGVAAWGDEAQQQGINGFVANEVVNFRIFDVEAGIEYAAEPTLFQDHLGIYAPNGFSVVVSLDATDILRGGGGGPVVIGPGESIDVPVFFNPEEAGDFNGMATVFSDDPNNPEAEVGLIGVGVFNAPAVVLSDQALDFEEVAVGSESTLVLTISNDGGQDLEVALAVQGDYFSINHEAEFAVAGGQSVDVPVVFEPGERGELGGVLVVTSNDPENEAIPVLLSGIGIAPVIAADEEVLEFGEVFIGNEGIVEATISNEGDDLLVIDDWSVDNEDFRVEVDFQHQFDWEFDQTDNNASILVASASIGQNDLVEGDVIGVFTPAGLCCGYTRIEGEYPVGISAWGDEAQRPGINGFVDGDEILYRFWDADPGREHRAHANYIEGDGEYHPNGFYVVELTEGGNNPLDLEAPIELGPGEEITATVIFSPSEAREYNNTWTIISNDPVNPEFEVGLHGIGLPVNRPPEWVVVPPENVEWPEGELLQAPISAEDPDGDELTLWMEDLVGNLPEEAVFVDNEDGTGLFTWDVGYLAAGEYHIVGYCSDGLIRIETHTMLSVTNTNRIPVWDEEFYAIEGYENDVVEFTVSAQDPDIDDELTIEMTGDLPQETFTDNGDGTATVTWQTGYDDAGTYNLTFTINDGYEDVRVDAEIEVINVNRAPEVRQAIGDVNIEEDSGYNFIANLDEVFFDPDGDRMRYSIVNLDDLREYGLAIDNQNDLSATPADDFNGRAQVILNADDGVNDIEMVVNFSNRSQPRQANRAMRSVVGEADLNRDENVDSEFTLTVTPMNDFPVWEAYPEPIEAQETDLIEFNLVASDIDGDDLEITVAGDGVPVDALTDNGDGTAVFSWQTDHEDAGDYVATFTAFDGEARALIDVEISIANLNRDCFWVDPIDSYGGAENDLVEFTMTGNDPDQDDRLTMTITDSDLPDGDWFTDNGDGTGDFAWQTGWYDAGTYNVTFMLTDGEAEANTTVEINIGNVNRDPSLDEVDAIRVDEGALIEFTLNATDPDEDDVLTFGFTDRDGLPDEAVITDNEDGTADFAWQTDFFSGGTYNPVFYVDDGYTTAEIGVMITIEQVLQHYTDFEITNVNHSVIIETITFEDEVVPTGWEVGVFTPGDLLCGGEIWVDDGEGIGIAAWGDVAGDQEIDGFLPGERMNFRVWDDVADEEYNALSEVSDGTIFWQSNGLTMLSLSVSGLVEQVVDFRDGWNIVSINVVPGPQYWREGEDRGADIVMMLEQFGEQGPNADPLHHVILIKNDIGDFYAPRIPFNNLRYWDNLEGYYMNVDFQGLEELSGTWEGTQIAADADLPIPHGWCFIPYYPTYELDASRRGGYYVLASILDYVIIAKNTLGDFMAPWSGNGFSNMPPWRPGQGYQVRLDTPNEEPIIFNYPPQQDQGAAFIPPAVADNHWAQPAVTGGNMSVLINAVNGYSVTVDDQIAAFNTDGNLVGLGKVDPDGRCGLAVWGDDIFTDKVDGLANGEAFELKLWDADRAEEINLVTTNVHFGSGNQYLLDDLTMLDVTIQAEIPDAYYLSKAYPNPFNPVAHMTYGMPEAGKISVKVFDLNGRHVATLAQGIAEAGNHTLTWNAGDMVSGVYVIRMEAAQFRATQKVVLVK